MKGIFDEIGIRPKKGKVREDDEEKEDGSEEGEDESVDELLGEAYDAQCEKDRDGYIASMKAAIRALMD